MKFIRVACLALLLSAPLVGRGEEISVDGFSQATVGEFPNGWKTYPLQMGKAKRVYRIAQEGEENFLRAVDVEFLSVTAFRSFPWDVDKYPYLKFRWRAQSLPEKTAGEWREVDDHACGVFVGFGFASALKYVWSSNFPAGSFWAKKPGKFVIVAREFGPARAGRWQEVTVDVKGDFEKYFGKPFSGKPSGLAVLSDGEGSRQRVACDYAAFRVSDLP